MTLTGTLRVPLPADEAFRLFTARGERDWVDGWEPHFPDPVDDDVAAKADQAILLLAGEPATEDRGNIVVRILDGLGF